MCTALGDQKLPNSLIPGTRRMRKRRVRGGGGRRKRKEEGRTHSGLLVSLNEVFRISGGNKKKVKKLENSFNEIIREIFHDLGKAADMPS